MYAALIQLYNYQSVSAWVRRHVHVFMYVQYMYVHALDVHIFEYMYVQVN